MNSTAKLYGLVLSGGKSLRMGKDKGSLLYHGIPQREYLYKLLEGLCERTFISIRNDQKREIPNGMNVLIDQDRYKGPYNGLLTAFDKYPDVAWLVVACDLPLLDKPALKQLIAARNPKILATAFATRESQLPEPLCAIWEPKALKDSIAYLGSGAGSCPRKFLIQNEVRLEFPDDESVLLNANSEAEYKEAWLKLESP